MAVPRLGCGNDCAGPACASAAASQIAVSGPAVADRSAVHHSEAKTGASACRIFFFKRRMPDQDVPRQAYGQSGQNNAGDDIDEIVPSHGGRGQDDEQI